MVGANQSLFVFCKAKTLKSFAWGHARALIHQKSTEQALYPTPCPGGKRWGDKNKVLLPREEHNVVGWEACVPLTFLLLCWNTRTRSNLQIQANIRADILRGEIYKRWWEKCGQHHSCTWSLSLKSELDNKGNNDLSHRHAYIHFLSPFSWSSVWLLRVPALTSPQWWTVTLSWKPNKPFLN